jgi:hypothetical protein
MRFLLRLSNKGNYRPEDRKRLSTAAYETVRGLGADIGNLRVSSSAVEFDLLLDSKESLDEAVKVLEKEIGPMLTMRELDVETTAHVGSEDAIRLGLRLFNEERYWESHEALEIAWRRFTGVEKEVLQGIILIAAALVHLQKNEPDVALSVLLRGYGKLAASQGKQFGVDMVGLKHKVAAMISSDHPSFFTIETQD